MANRVRNKQIIVRVTEEERALIDLKMSQLPTSRLNSNVAGEHKKVIAKNVENTAGHNGECRKRRIVIIAQKCRKHLVEQKSGNTYFIGRIYSCARASSDLSAPKNVRIFASKTIIPIHEMTDKTAEPINAAVKY